LGEYSPANLYIKDAFLSLYQTIVIMNYDC